MRARSSASATSWSEAPRGRADSATTVAQRRTARVPSIVSASRTVSIWRGSAKKAELTWRSSAIESPTSAPMMRSRSSNDASARGQLARAPAARPTAPPPPSPRTGRAKNSPWKCVKPSTRQRVKLVGGRDAGGDEHQPALGRLGDQRLQRLVVAAADRDLDVRAEIEQRRGAPSRRARARTPPSRNRRAPLRARRPARAARRSRAPRAPAARRRRGSATAAGRRPSATSSAGGNASSTLPSPTSS